MNVFGRLMGLAFAGLAALVAMPAAAQPDGRSIEALRCVHAGLSEQGREAVGQFMWAVAVREQTSEQHRIAMEALAVAGAPCITRYGWDTRRANIAKLHAASVSASAYFRARLAQAGVGIARWDAAYEAITPSFRTRQSEGTDVSRDDMTILNDHASAAIQADPEAHREPRAPHRAFTYFLMRAEADNAENVWTRPDPR